METVQHLLKTKEFTCKKEREQLEKSFSEYKQMIETIKKFPHIIGISNN